ncbi:MAG TPA: gluconate 2-dehydrogenase subunit 3 family protein [Longimicrobiales bacterium]
MQRRDLLRILGGALALPVLRGLSPAEAFALGRELHRTIERMPGGRVLDEHQLEMVAAITESIIPATDTPGAREARVAEFIDLMLADWYDEPDRRRLLDGLVQIDARSRAAHGAPFVQLSEAQQMALLDGLDAEVQALRDADLETDGHFFQQLKWLTVHGYYTSDVGVHQELKWMPIPGGYDPCKAFVPRTVGES